MLVAHACDGCSSAPLTQNKNNPIYQEITAESKNFAQMKEMIAYILICKEVKVI